MVGTPLGYYRLLTLLRSDACGELGRARDSRTEREVALRLLAREAARRGFQR